MSANYTASPKPITVGFGEASTRLNGPHGPFLPKLTGGISPIVAGLFPHLRERINVRCRGCGPWCSGSALVSDEHRQRASRVIAGEKRRKAAPHFWGRLPSTPNLSVNP